MLKIQHKNFNKDVFNTNTNVFYCVHYAIHKIHARRDIIILSGK